MAAFHRLQLVFNGMASLTDLQSQLRGFPCHFMWELEKKSIKQFGSLIKLIDEHISDSPAMLIEGLLFKSYLFFSGFRGNAEKNKAGAMECIDELRRRIRGEDPCRQPSNNGHLAIAIALEAWFDRRDKKRLESNIWELRKLNSLYEDGSQKHNMFKGSIHATKGFALSRVGMNRYSESIKEFETALELCPGEKDWLFSVGLVRWRLAKAAVKNRHEFCPDMTTVLSIFYDVLKMDSEHSLALVYIAEIRRRQKNIHKARQFLKNALRKHPVRQKVLGEAIGVYRKMACFDEAIRAIHAADKLEEPYSSFIYHQAYLVYRDISATKYRGQYSPPKIDYLQKAIDTNPSNLAAKFDRAKELIYARKYDEATEYYNQLLENVEDDPEYVIRINSQFALFLQKQKKQNEAIDKHQMVIDVALEEFQEDRGPPIIFFMEIDWVVKQSIETVEKFHKKVLSTDPRNIPSRLQLAELKDKLGNTKCACWHFQKALDLNIDEERMWNILEYLAAVKTKNKTLDDVDVIIEHMKQLNISYPKPDVINERKAALAVERGKVALRNDKKEDAIRLFKESTTLGNITGAKFLLDEVKQMDRENRNVCIYCAHIDICIENSLEEDKELSNELQENISKLLSADSSSVGIVLQDLREAQFRMERSVLQNSAQLVSLRVDVIHKCRTILNQTMTKFRDRHYTNVDSSCDYFNIPKCSSVDIANKVKKRLQTSYKWAKFSERFPSLLEFLVSIQPASNPQENNWLFALLRMDNSNKHESPLGDKLKINVYSDELGNMAEREFLTLDVAREACDKIKNILDAFYMYLS